MTYALTLTTDLDHVNTVRILWLLNSLPLYYGIKIRILKNVTLSSILLQVNPLNTFFQDFRVNIDEIIYIVY